MFKKIFVCTALLLFSLALVAGCGSEEELTYNDGTYTAVSANANDRGYVEVSITIAGDEITAVSMVEYDGFDNAKDYATYGREGVFDGAMLEEAHEALAAAMVENNTWDVDAVSGATSTSGKAKSAAEFALAKALVEPAGNTYFNGVFFAVSDPDTRGSIVQAVVEINNDAIVSVKFADSTIVDDQAVWKDYEDYGVPGNFDGQDLKEAHEALAAAMVAGNTYDVDIITGATGTSNKAIEAVQRALANAEL